jgi:hypothetical protein
MNAEEKKYVDLLSLFHYIVGGLVALFSCMFLGHFFIGLAVVTGRFTVEDSGTTPPGFFGWMFLIIGAICVLGGWAIASCMIIAGTKLKKRKAWVFCLIVAGLECMFMPFGTVLGVFTLILLNKDSIKRDFISAPPAVDGV